jgi:hypothetical protein
MTPGEDTASHPREIVSTSLAVYAPLAVAARLSAMRSRRGRMKPHKTAAFINAEILAVWERQQRRRHQD